MKMRSTFWGLAGCALALQICGCGKPPREQPDTRSTIQAVINYSVAPWDGPAYELMIPLPKFDQAPSPFIRIRVWGNPEFQQPHTLRLSGETGPGESGSASFQPVLDESLPEVLTGTISFANLKQGLPVSGSFDLSTSHGRTFTGRFQATWGNEQLPYIR